MAGIKQSRDMHVGNRIVVNTAIERYSDPLDNQNPAIST